MFPCSPPVYKMDIPAFSLLCESNLRQDALNKRKSSDTQIEGINIEMGLMCSNSMVIVKSAV